MKYRYFSIIAMSVLLINILGCSNDSGDNNNNNKPALPSAPQNVQINPSIDQLTLSWDSVDGASSYNIYWNNQGNVSGADNQISTANLSYDHTGLNDCETYHYIVTAVNSSGESSPSIEVSDVPLTVVSDVWNTKTPMPTSRAGAAASIVNGKLYVIGGTTDWSSPLDIVEEYDPDTDTWTTKAPMPTARSSITSSVVNGKIYVFGGYDFSTRLNTVEEYDPDSNSWTTKASMPTARYSTTSSSVKNKIYVIGGRFQGSPASFSNAVEEYDPEVDQWTAKMPLSTERGSITSTSVHGKIYIFGGYNFTSTFNSVEEYDPSNDTWTSKTSMPTARHNAMSAEISNKIYVLGGGAGNSNNLVYYSSVEEYDPVTDSWTIKSSMPTARYNLEGGAYNCKIYAVGGTNNYLSGTLSTVEEYQ